MNASLKKTYVITVVATVALVLAGMVGCSNKTAYSVDYKIVSDGFNAGIEATVKGPAAKLAVILTDPKGVADIQTIEKSQMIANSQTVKVAMRDLQAGIWILAVKTIDPEKVVWQEDIPLSLGQLAVVDIGEFNLIPNPFGAVDDSLKFLTGFKVVLKKDGNLPVEFIDYLVEVNGKKCSLGIPWSHFMVDGQDKISISVLPPIKCLPGERHMVKGKLFYGKDSQFLNFEKEFVVPQHK